MRANTTRVLLLALAASAIALAANGCGDTDTADRVHDLRMLAMRAEPPEQVLRTSFSFPGGGGSTPRDGGAAQDGGLSFDGGLPFDAGGLSALLYPDGGIDYCLAIALISDGGLVLPPGFDAGLPQDFDAGCAIPDGGLSVPSLVQPVTVTALVADPKGAGRNIHYAWSVCAHLNANSRCETDSPAYLALSEGDVQGSVSNELSVTFTPGLDLLTQALKLDALHGFGGMPLPVQLRIQAGSENVVGYKYVVFTPPVGTMPVIPNTNPVLDSVLLDNNAWGPADSPTLGDNRKVSQDNAGADPANRLDAGNNMKPDFDAGAQEEYTRLKYDLTTVVHLKEAWRFNFFATAGTFSRDQTGGQANVITGQAAQLDTSWSPDVSDGEQDVTVWVVVRDGRGGESWVKRNAHYKP